jgi:hypothetical protein
MMLDGFQPEGFTELTVDSIFMMPQLGVLSTVHEEAAVQVFTRDCLIRLGWAVAPRGTGKPRAGQTCMSVELRRRGGGGGRCDVKCGEIKVLELGLGERATVVAMPARGFDLGRGPGQIVERDVSGGVVGLILDGRGRPIRLPAEKQERTRKLVEWNVALAAYPKE